MSPAESQNENTTTATNQGRMSSLEILLSEKLSTRPSPTACKSPIETLLEDLCIRITNRVSAREWNHSDVKEMLAEDYSAYLEYQSNPYVRGRDNYIRCYNNFMLANPEYSITPISTVAHLHESRTTAVVWMLLRVNGHPRSVQRESVTVVHWRLKAGRWQAFKQTGVRGVAAY